MEARSILCSASTTGLPIPLVSAGGYRPSNNSHPPPGGQDTLLLLARQVRLRLQRNLQHVLDVLRRDPCAFLWRTPRRRVQLDIQEPAPLRTVEVSLQLGKLDSYGGSVK